MNKLLIIAAFLLPLAAFQSCKKDKSKTDNKSVQLELPETVHEYYTGRKIVTPNQNEKTTLGRVLFYDTRLSLNNAVSCASCHKQEFAFSDNAAFSRGFENRLTGRNSMPLENLVFHTDKFSLSMVSNITAPPGSGTGPSLFWDGRENSLQGLIARPLTNHIEMGIEDVSTLPQKLANLDHYKELFAVAYPYQEITFDQIAESIAFFITSIKSSNTRYDQFIAKKTSFTAMELEGMALFNGKYDCSNCHRIDTNGYQGSAFMDIGLAATNGDKGMGGFTGLPGHVNTFRAPNLRNVALTAPYMHDGRFKTLHEVLDHYSGGIQDSPNLNEMLKEENGQPRKMNISENEKQALIAFLNTLTDYEMVTAKQHANPFVIK
jgi:cytochrome c peroxidase